MAGARATGMIGQVATPGSPSARLTYAAVSIVDAALAASGRRRPRWITKPALMPLLMPGRDRPTQTALALAWAGDVALLGRSEPAFLTGLGSFLGSHLVWIEALRRRKAATTDAEPAALSPRAQAAVVTGYSATAVALNAVLWRRIGPMRPAVIGYSAVLVGMAAVTARSPRRSTVAGGALFVLSDSLLALDRFTDVRLPGHDGWVMASYTAAQALLAEGSA